jgi:hypothetical protein
MNSNIAAASHQLSSFFGASSGFWIAVFPRPNLALGGAADGKVGVGAGDDFEIRVCFSGCTWIWS